MYWRMDLRVLKNGQICCFLDVSETFLSLNRFANDPWYTLEAAERKYTRAISKHMKTYESG